MFSSLLVRKGDPRTRFQTRDFRVNASVVIAFEKTSNITQKEVEKMVETGGFNFTGRIN